MMNVSVGFEYMTWPDTNLDACLSTETRCAQSSHVMRNSSWLLSYKRMTMEISPLFGISLNCCFYHTDRCSISHQTVLEGRMTFGDHDPRQDHVLDQWSVAVCHLRIVASIPVRACFMTRVHGGQLFASARGISAEMLLPCVPFLGCLCSLESSTVRSCSSDRIFLSPSHETFSIALCSTELHKAVSSAQMFAPSITFPPSLEYHLPESFSWLLCFYIL